MAPISKFCLPLALEYLDGRSWRLLSAFTFGSVTYQGVIAIPAGFETDFASIPRVLWAVLPPTGPYGKAVLVHDAIYRTPAILCSRREGDRVLLEAMEELGVGWWTRQIIYRGVRFGGRRYFTPRFVPTVPLVSLEDVDRYTRRLDDRLDG